jgi:hypothetical protein
MQGKSTAQKEQENAQIMADNEKWCPARGAELKKGYEPQCHDNTCKAGVFLLAADYGPACVKGSNGLFNTPTPAQKWAQTWESTHIKKFETLIDESILRDPAVGPTQKLAILDCRPFLGRPAESLCAQTKGFDFCKKLVDGKSMSRCLLAGTNAVYPLPSATQSVSTGNQPIGSAAANPAATQLGNGLGLPAAVLPAGLRVPEPPVGVLPVAPGQGLATGAGTGIGAVGVGAAVGAGTSLPGPAAIAPLPTAVPNVPATRGANAVSPPSAATQVPAMPIAPLPQPLPVPAARNPTPDATGGLRPAVRAASTPVAPISR